MTTSARDHQPVRGVQHGRRLGDLQPAPAPPGQRVQEVPGQDLRPGPRRPPGAPVLRQLRHAQTPDGEQMARGAVSVPYALHPTYSSWLNQVERSSATSPPTCSNEATTAASKPWKAISATGSRPGTRIPSPSSGPRPPNRSSPHSADFFNELPARNTSRGWLPAVKASGVDFAVRMHDLRHAR